MKAESNVKPKDIEIENIQNDRCDIVICDNIQEIIEDDITRYIFDFYRLNICYYENIENEIKTHFNLYLERAKKNEYKILATEIRSKRNELLKETDKEMCIDRLGLNFPKDLSMTNIISSLKQFFYGFSNIVNGNMAKYRQELRDITKQEGFPYNVIWPTKDKANKEE